jgi:hypothetical protein
LAVSAILITNTALNVVKLNILSIKYTNLNLLPSLLYQITCISNLSTLKQHQNTSTSSHTHTSWRLKGFHNIRHGNKRKRRIRNT